MGEFFLLSAVLGRATRSVLGTGLHMPEGSHRGEGIKKRPVMR